MPGRMPYMTPASAMTGWNTTPCASRNNPSIHVTCALARELGACGSDSDKIMKQAPRRSGQAGAAGRPVTDRLHVFFIRADSLGRNRKTRRGPSRRRLETAAAKWAAHGRHHHQAHAAGGRRAGRRLRAGGMRRGAGRGASGGRGARHGRAGGGRRRAQAAAGCLQRRIQAGRRGPAGTCRTATCSVRCGRGWPAW